MIINHSSPTAPKRINDNRVKQMRSGFYYAPLLATFQTDELSLDLILGRVAKILAMKSLGQTHPVFQWRDEGDVDHSFTQDEFLAFFIAIDAYMEGKIIESWQKKAAL